MSQALLWKEIEGGTESGEEGKEEDDYGWEQVEGRGGQGDRFACLV